MGNKKFVVLLLSFVFFSFCLQAQVRRRPPITSHSRLSIAMANGKNIYTQNCLSCHQADGGGIQNMNPPLIQTDYVLGDKTRLIKIVLNGFKEDVEINGQTYSNNMTPHAFLTDKQIADVLTYIRHSFTNKASTVTAAQVKMVRAGK